MVHSKFFRKSEKERQFESNNEGSSKHRNTFLLFAISFVGLIILVREHETLRNITVYTSTPVNQLVELAVGEPYTTGLLIEAPPFPKPFTFYVYDQFKDNEYSPYKISKFLTGAHASGNCEWALQTCIDDGTADSRYSSRRKNFNADVVIADLFLRYPVGTAAPFTPFAIKTLNPAEADLFVVPYAHDSHCKTISYDNWCTPDKNEQVMAVLETLKYFSGENSNVHVRSRHLFLSSSDYPFSNHKYIEAVPMRTTLGDLKKPECLVPDPPAPNSNVDTWLCPDIVIPYLNQYPDFQPPALKSKSDDWWITRDRGHSLTAMFGPLLCDTCLRNGFLDAVNTTFPDRTLAGLPVHIGSLGSGRNMPQEQAAFELYQDSIFCLILPGDGPAQKRFFDVILSGCIPVAFVLDRYGDNSGVVSSDNHNRHPSWWDGLDATVSMQTSIRTAYPFAKGLFPDQPDLGIDYESFVVQIRPSAENGCHFGCGHTRGAACRWDCVKPTLEALINEPDQTELKRIRSNLRRVAGWFAYGLQDTAFQSYDAFAVILTQVGHTLERMPPLRPSDRATN